MRTAALCAALLAAACGATLSRVVTASSPSPAAVLFDCATAEAEGMGFDRSSHDKREYRLVAARTDPDVRLAENTFRRGFDQLIVEIEAGDRAADAEFSVTARSFHEFFDRAGVRLVERDASEGAQRAARELLEACTAPAGGGEAEAP